MSFSTEEQESNVMFFTSSIICADILFVDLEMLNLNLSDEDTFFALFLILNLFVIVLLLV